MEREKPNKMYEQNFLKYTPTLILRPISKTIPKLLYPLWLGESWFFTY